MYKHKVIVTVTEYFAITDLSRPCTIDYGADYRLHLHNKKNINGWTLEEVLVYLNHNTTYLFFLNNDLHLNFSNELVFRELRPCKTQNNLYHIFDSKKKSVNLILELNNLPPCLSLDPPCAPNPRTSETVTPRIPIFNRALSN